MASNTNNRTNERTNQPTNSKTRAFLDEKGDASTLYILPTSCPPFRPTLDRVAQWVALGVSKPIPFRCREVPQRCVLATCIHIYLHIYIYIHMHTHHTYTSLRKLSGSTRPSLVLKFKISKIENKQKK